jgi:isoleucyl-tRNA synthetase
MAPTNTIYRVSAMGSKMTHNVLEDGSFRPDLPLLGGALILKPNGKEGDANKRVIEN